ncbi:hypothetical protein JCGZ_12327 [Jatropha curcas]|uniref:(S)-hydroxynitrile lyase n=1 Tax=Jatropha curcas TaxID=180498 RepID=A0A067K6K2_JATCU|nr:methylesterase 1 [Jatropha curcas]KDP31866.1 hypothetical protein JCGZ_12327 [Jatropha curcas]
MEDMKQRHFVLVHGACHGAWCWYKVVSLLQLAGHKVTALDLSASGVNPKQMKDLHSISDYFDPLIEFMRSLPEEEKVIIVGHSMGGLSISAAMERFPEKISAGVFAAAFMPGPDLSYLAIKEEFDKEIDDKQVGVEFIYDKKIDDKSPIGFQFGPKCLSNMLYQLSPNEDLVLATFCLRPFPLCGGTPNVVISKEKYGSVPRIYVVCDQDKIIPEGLQRWMIKNNPTDEVKVINGSDHMVMFSKPQELCSCLQEIAMKYM